MRAHLEGQRDRRNRRAGDRAGGAATDKNKDARRRIVLPAGTDGRRDHLQKSVNLEGRVQAEMACRATRVRNRQGDGAREWAAIRERDWRRDLYIDPGDGRREQDARRGRNRIRPGGIAHQVAARPRTASNIRQVARLHRADDGIGHKSD